MPVEKSILITVPIPKVKVNTRKVPVRLDEVELLGCIIPVANMFPDLMPLWIPISRAVDKGLKIISPALFYGQSKRAIAI